MKEITNVGSDCDIRYIYIYKDRKLNIKDINQTPSIESFKHDLPYVKIDAKSVDLAGALSLSTQS